MKEKIQDFMTEDEANAYSLAAGLSAANEPDRAAWSAGVNALQAAEERAIQEWSQAGKPVRLNRFGRPHGGVHPALLGLKGYFSLNGCYAPEI